MGEYGSGPDQVREEIDALVVQHSGVRTEDC